MQSAGSRPRKQVLGERPASQSSAACSRDFRDVRQRYAVAFVGLYSTSYSLHRRLGCVPRRQTAELVDWIPVRSISRSGVRFGRAVCAVRKRDTYKTICAVNEPEEGIGRGRLSRHLIN